MQSLRRFGRASRLLRCSELERMLLGEGMAIVLGEKLPFEYPFNGSPEERLRAAVGVAVLAPSGHNTQPWLFRIADSWVDLIADRSRALPVVDPDDRELVISCGAALHHLTTCLSAMGEGLSVSILPDAAEPDLLARVRLDGGAVEAPERARRWLRAAFARRTTRCAFEPFAHGAATLVELGLATAAEGAELYVVEGAARHALTSLVAEADREQLSHKPFRRELAAWVHPNRSRHRDGIPGYAQGLGDLMSMLGPFVVRTFDIGESQAVKDEHLAEHSPVLAVIATATDDVAAHVRAGRALSALLLEATSAGLAASFLNQPIELVPLRSRVAALLPATVPRFPQLVLRLGAYRGPAQVPVPRREVAEVLL